MRASLLYAYTLLYSKIIDFSSAGDDGSFATGVPHTTVQVLEQSTFETALDDPANGLWLLKFYAPWCGHCKKMAPTLDKLAPYLAGKLAIGKIDCTTQKPLCNKHDVRGYPTLKIFRDGDFFDYPGRRDADSIIEFAEKMSKPAVTMASSAGEVLNLMSGSDSSSEVVFVAYDPKAKETKSPGKELTKVEKILASTKSLQIFNQVARKLQAEGEFVMLNPSISKQELALLNIKGNKHFLAKIEDDIDPVIYDGQLTSPEFLGFVNDNKLGTIVELNSHNFRSVGHMGRPLAIGVFDPNKEDSTTSLIQNMKEYIKSASKEDSSIYRFAKMDGVKWDKFLAQFSITPDKLPQILVLDVPGRTYYQHDSILPDMSTFLKSIEDGTIEKRIQETGGGGTLEKIHDLFVRNMPYSLLLPILSFILIFIVTLPSEDDMESYQSKPIQKKIQSKSLKED